MYPAGVFHFQHRPLVAASNGSPGGLYTTGGISTDWGMGCRLVYFSSLHGEGVVSEGEVCFIFYYFFISEHITPGLPNVTDDKYDVIIYT